MGAALLCAVGLFVALGAHIGIKVAEHRAREEYRKLVGEEAGPDAPDDAWKDVRSLVGSWGCLTTALEFIRGLGLAVALGAGLYLVTRR